MTDHTDEYGMTLYERIDFLYTKLRQAERAFEKAVHDSANVPFEDCEAMLRSINAMSTEIDRLESLASDIKQGR